MTREIRPAVRRGLRSRVMLAGPTGSGKTWTSLVIARALAGKDGKVLVIDTERGSAALYADDFSFSVVDWQPPYSPIDLTNFLAEHGKDFACIVIDSLTHFWISEGGTLDVVDAAAARAGGNKFAAWKIGTPVQNRMVEAILASPAHVLVTVRSKMDYVQDKDDRGKTVIRRVGMSPIQRDGVEYDFTVVAELDQEHRLVVTKSRCHPIADKVYQPHRANEMAREIAVWLDTAAPDEPVAASNNDVPSHPGQSAGVTGEDDSPAPAAALSLEPTPEAQGAGDGVDGSGSGDDKSPGPIDYGELLRLLNDLDTQARKEIIAHYGLRSPRAWLQETDPETVADAVGAIRAILAAQRAPA